MHPASGSALRAIRADYALDGDRPLRGGVRVLVEGEVIGVEPGGAEVPEGCSVSYVPGTRCFPV